jgi:flagellar protein FlaG
VTIANQLVSEHTRRLSFDLHEDSDRMVVRVIDQDTNEVIRQIPPEQVLASLVELRRFVGLLLDRLT